MIILILVIATILRLISLNQSLWLDEAINVTFGSRLSLFDFLTKYTIADFHPPGYFFILWIWMHIFGTSEIAVRVPSVALGVGTVYLVYLIGRKLWNSNIGLLAAFFLSVSPLHIYYSQEARMYSLATFAVCASFYWLIRLLETPKSKKILFFYGLSVAFVLYSDYVAYLILPVQLVIVFWQDRSQLKKVFSGQLLGFCTLLPWLFYFPLQLANGRQTSQVIPGWKSVVGGSGLKDVGLVWVKILIGRISFDNKIMYGAIIGFITLIYGVILYPLINLKKERKNIKMLSAWFILPIVLAFLTSFFIPILSYFRLLFIVPALTLLLTAGVSNFPKKMKFAVITIVLIINLIFSGIYLFNPKYQREDWRGLANFLYLTNNTQSIVLFENSELPAPFSYYSKDQITAQGALSRFPATSQADLINLDQLLQPKTKVYLVDYLVEISDPGRQVAKKLQAIGFNQTKIDNFNGVGFVYEYVRAK